MLFDFFKFKHECAHKRVSPGIDEAYCPDCGAFVRNKWYIIKCSCCGIKRDAHIMRGDIIPDTKFCKNCGSERFYIKELDKLNFTDIRYAVFKKIVINQKTPPAFSQIWTDEPAGSSAGNIEPIPALSDLLHAKTL